jgi:hypothetical protein
MAKFYKAPDGSYGLRHGLSIALPIPDGAEIVEFDEQANIGLIDSLSGQGGFRWQDHSIVGGQIIRAGGAVAINPPRELNDIEQLGAAVVALALLSLDEINVLRQWIVSFTAATAAASSLANLQARVAALPNVPDRTRAQLLAAVRAKLTDV